MQEQVHARDGGGGQVFFLAEQLAPQCAVILMPLTDVVYGFQQHAARSAGGVVDGFAFARVEDIHHQPHD